MLTSKPLSAPLPPLTITSTNTKCVSKPPTQDTIMRILNWYDFDFAPADLQEKAKPAQKPASPIPSPELPEAQEASSPEPAAATSAPAAPAPSAATGNGRASDAAGERKSVV